MNIIKIDWRQFLKDHTFFGWYLTPTSPFDPDLIRRLSITDKYGSYRWWYTRAPWHSGANWIRCYRIHENINVE